MIPGAMVTWLWTGPHGLSEREDVGGVSEGVTVFCWNMVGGGFVGWVDGVLDGGCAKIALWVLGKVGG